jgi:hypothetical protein
MSGDVNTSGGVENMSAGLHNQPAQTPLSGRGTGGGQTLTAKSEPDHVPMS